MVHIASQNKRGKYSHAKTGKYLVQNPKKYMGAQMPIYKSQLEFLCMRYLDSNDNVLAWSYEPMAIKYFDRVHNKVRRYYIDFTAVLRVGNFKKTVWIEVKSEVETKPPKNKNNAKDQATWLTNCCKWQSAQALARTKGYEFHILTEAQLT